MRRLMIGVVALVAVLLVAISAGQSVAAVGDILQTYYSPTTDERFGVEVEAFGSNMVLVGAYQARKVYLFDAAGASLLHPFTIPTSSLFGYSVTSSGNSVLIGAPFDSTNGSNAGAAYLYTHTGTDWTQNWQNTHTCYGPAANAHFGFVAAMGSNFLIGAPGEGTNRGAAYLYDGSTCALLKKFQATDGTAGDRFGSAVAGSGNTVVVGAPNRQSFKGAAYKYQYNGSTWPETPIANPGSHGLFGDSVALTGSKVFVGASDGQSGATQGGAVYLFDGSNPPIEIPDPGSGVDRFGSSIAPHGNYLLVGAPWDNHGAGAAYLFDLTDPTNVSLLWAGHGGANDQYGHSVNWLGDNILLGAPFAHGPPENPYYGAVYLIEGVPEPSSLVLVAVGAIGLLSCAWRRRRT